MTEAEEVGYHDGFFPVQQTEETNTSDHPHSNDYLLSTSPTGQVVDGVERSPENDTFDRHMLPTVIEDAEPSPSDALLPADAIDEMPPPTPLIDSHHDTTPQEHLHSSRLAAMQAKEDRERHLQHLREQYRTQARRKSTTSQKVAEVVFFEYGVTVFFGLTEKEERDVLEDCESAGVWFRSLPQNDWEVEECHYVSAMSRSGFAFSQSAEPIPIGLRSPCKLSQDL